MALMIYSNEKNFTGTKNGVRFMNGKARVLKAVAQDMIQKGVCYCPQLGVDAPKEKAPVKSKSGGKK